MSDLSFEIRIDIPQGSEAWGQLLPEIPQHATLLEASMWVQPNRQWLLLVYRGANPDGEQHRRKSQQRVSLSTVQALSLIDQAYPRSQRAAVLAQAITTREVAMSTTPISPEALVDAFVSSTGKKHMLEPPNADTPYLTPQCSSAYSHGTAARLPAKDIDCMKCRKILGLDG